ncbi:MAG: hypothetical protein VYA69_00025 [Gemmatimonadota bacterium]|nr:hypothetical protein [Gemmatimonadota bacterium]
MVLGQFQWRKPGSAPKSRNDLLAFQFSHGTLMITEKGTKKRASIYVVANENEYRHHDPGGIDW